MEGPESKEGNKWKKKKFLLYALFNLQNRKICIGFPVCSLQQVRKTVHSDSVLTIWTLYNLTIITLRNLFEVGGSMLVLTQSFICLSNRLFFNKISYKLSGF